MEYSTLAIVLDEIDPFYSLCNRFQHPDKKFRRLKIVSGQSLLLSFQELFGYLLSDDRRVAAGPVIDDNAGLDTLLDCLPHKVGSLLHHLRLQHSLHELIEGMGFGVSKFIAHSDRGHEPDGPLSSGVEDLLTRFR